MLPQEFVVIDVKMINYEKSRSCSFSLRLTEGDGVWDSSGHHDTNQIEEYKKAARNLGKDAGEKAPRFQ